MKNQKGITLIALVITIIVLLILAGVSIAMLTGDNGLLNKSKEGVAASAIAGAKDEVVLAHQEAMAKWLDDKYNNEDFDETTDTFASYFDNALASVTGDKLHGCTKEGDAASGITIKYDKYSTKGSLTTTDEKYTLSWTKIQ